MTDRFNAQTYLVTRNVDDGLGDKVAVRAGADTATYADLDGLCGIVAAALRETGVRSDDRVLMMMSDGLPMLAAILGCFRAGAVAVPVSTMQTAHELGTVLADSGARLVVCTPGVHRGRRGRAAAGARGRTTGRGGRRRRSRRPPPSARRRGRSSWPPAGRPPTHVGRSPTPTPTRGRSGSTPAAPPACPRPRCTGTPTSATSARPTAQQVLGIRPRRRDVLGRQAVLRLRHRQLAVLPASRSARPRCSRPQRPTPAIVAGARRRRAADALLRASRPSTPRCSRATCRTTRSPRSGWRRRRARRCPAPLLTRFKERFGVDIIDGIGSTEALHIFLSNRPGDIRARHDGQGRAGLRRRGRRRGRPRPAGRPARGAAGARRRRSRSATGSGPPPRGRSSRGSGWSPATPTSATPTATTPAWAATATCSSPAASGSRRPRSRAG